MIKYLGREWKWWLIYNDHTCKFCWILAERIGKDKIPVQRIIDMRLGPQTGLYMTDRRYWRRLYQVWLRHMKEYHPEILDRRLTIAEAAARGYI